MAKQDTVTIGCRVPNGLILRVSDWIDDPQNKGEKILKEIGVIELVGTGAHVSTPGLLQDEADAAITKDVPAKLWDAWLAQNGESDLVTSGAVFEAQAPTEEAKPDVDEAAAEKKADTTSKDTAKPGAK